MAGARAKTALRVHQIMLLQYDNTPEGICGNDDCGQMSASYAWSAIGLYPLNLADGRQAFLAARCVSKATINLDPKFYPGGQVHHQGQKRLQPEHLHPVRQAQRQAADRVWVTYDEIVHGGTLEFEMGILPKMHWEGAAN